MTDQEVITHVQLLLELPEHWTSHALARDMYKREVDPASPEATSWSLEGAISVAGGNTDAIQKYILEGARALYGGIRSLTDLNDRHGYHAVVMSVERGRQIAEGAGT